MQAISSVLRSLQIPHRTFSNVTYIYVPDRQQGAVFGTQILEHIVDQRTALLVSGGKTPLPLYQLISQSDIQIGAVGMIDERYGQKFHSASNEHMLQDSGLLRYLHLTDTHYFPILEKEESIEDTAKRYDEVVRNLTSRYRQLVGVLGIGADGHTAGIAPNRHDFKNPLFSSKNYSYVDWFNDEHGSFKQRITLTFLGLSMLDLFLIVCFGEDKKKALQMMFEKGKEEEIPARFYVRPEIAKKTVLITDQEIEV